MREVGASLPEQLNGQARWHSLIEENFEVSADREQLHRVLSNLGQNAVQAGATKVEVVARRDDDRFVIDVTDNGPGLSPRARAHLFKPFAGSSHPGGTGLGLAIARELMRAHGGDVQLERSTSEGTSFRLILPADRGQR